VALFAALIVPWFVDWTNYKRAFEREASLVIGQPVTVAGGASLRLLPLPGFTFSELSVGRYDDGTAMMTVDRFSLTTELLPFLRGEMRIVDMRLDSPHLTIRVNENGTVDWTARKNLIVDPDNVQIELLQIENGTLQIDGLAGGRSLRGEGISASVSTQSLFGPWRISASGEFEGAPSSVQVATGRRQADGTVNLRATALRQGSPYRYFADGPVSVKDNIVRWAGGFEITPIVSQDRSDTKPLPVRAQGKFEATPESMDVAEYRLEIGNQADPYTITGSVVANMREDIQFHMTAVGRQIDIDRLDNSTGEVGTNSSLDRRLSAVQHIVDQIPVPAAMGEIEFSLPAIVAGDTVIRDVQAKVSPDINGWRIADLSAVLPGNTEVAANGKLGRGGDFGFTGVMELHSAQPTGFAKWLSGNNNASLRRLNSAGFSAYVTLTGAQATFEDLTLTIDDVTLQGRLQRIPPVNGRGALIADLSGNEIDVDDLLAIYSLTQSSDDGSMTSHDLDIRLQAGLLKGAGMSAQDVESRIRVERGSISIDSLNAGDFYGARISSSGHLSDLLGRPEGNFGLSIRASAGSRLVQLAAARLGDNQLFSAWLDDPELTEGVSLEIGFDARPDGEQSQGQLSVSGSIGGTEIALHDRFHGRPALWRQADHDISLKLVQSEPEKLARQLSLPVIAVETPGPVTLTVEMSGSGQAGMATLVSANAPDSDFTANGNVNISVSNAISGLEVDFGFDVTLGSRNIDAWLLMAGYPLSDTGQGIPVSINCRATKDKGIYSLSEIDGQYDGIGVSGELEIDTLRPTRPKIGGRLRFGELSLAGLGEMLVGGGSLTTGEDGISVIPFSTGDLSDIDFDIELESETASVTDEQRISEFSARMVSLDGSVSVPEFEFDWLGGRNSGNASLKNVSGNIFVTMQFNAAGIALADAVSLAGFQDLATGDATLAIALDANGADLDELLTTLAGSGVVSAHDVRIRGVTTDGFGRIVDVADRDGFEIDKESVEQVARNTMLGASFAVPELSAPVAVTAGEAAIRNLSLSDNSGEIRINSEYSLTSGLGETSILVAPDPGRFALPTATPEATFSWSGIPGQMDLMVNAAPLESYLSLRAFEREQKRVAIMQSDVLEKQRLRREIATSLDRVVYHDRQRQEDIRQLQLLQEKLQPDPSDVPAIDETTPPKQEGSGALEGTGPVQPSPAEKSQTNLLEPLQMEQKQTGPDLSVLPSYDPVDITPTPRPSLEQAGSIEPQVTPPPPPQVQAPQSKPPRRRNGLMEALERLFGN
jgi:AsmA-like C-terminal region/AsmA family